jgi:hypothetical protein
MRVAEQLTSGGVQPEPACGEHALQVTVSDEGDVAAA